MLYIEFVYQLEFNEYHTRVALYQIRLSKIETSFAQNPGTCLQ